MTFRSFVLTALLSVALACGGNRPPAELALQTAKTSNQGLDLIQDVEAQLCFGTSTAIEARNTLADLATCTSPVAASVGLTKARHNAFGKAMEQAYMAHLKMTADLRMWTAGLPVPASVTDYATAAQAALTIARALAPNNATVQLLLVDAAALVKSGQDIVITLKGAK